MPAQTPILSPKMIVILASAVTDALAIGVFIGLDLISQPWGIPALVGVLMATGVFTALAIVLTGRQRR